MSFIIRIFAWSKYNSYGKNNNDEALSSDRDIAPL